MYTLKSLDSLLANGVLWIKMRWFLDRKNNNYRIKPLESLDGQNKGHLILFCDLKDMLSLSCQCKTNYILDEETVITSKCINNKNVKNLLLLLRQ